MPSLGSTAVVLSAAFLLLTLVQEILSPGLQQVIVSVLSNWLAMGGVAVGLWVTRQGWLGTTPAFLRSLAGFLMLSFALIATLGVLAWPPLWVGLERFGVTEDRIQPIALFSAFALWFLALIVFFLRGFCRWLGKRYQHHGIAIGFGPIYFYFRRRKSS